VTILLSIGIFVEPPNINPTSRCSNEPNVDDADEPNVDDADEPNVDEPNKFGSSASSHEYLFLFFLFFI
jgi:hypothetical protein